MQLAIEMKNITKIFPGVVANDDISFELLQGEIHALLGENGAGKSTLMNVLYGLYEPEKGEIFVNGKKVNIANPNIAIKYGIGMVHQHFMLVEKFTVLENIILGAEIGKKGMLDRKKAREEVMTLSKEYGLDIDPDATVRSISVGMQQRVEILKALFRGAEILILDEPTAVLTPQEIEDLIKIMSNLTKMNKSIIFITHKLKEVKSACDRVTVIRRGKKIGTVETADSSIEDLAEMMVGRKVLLDVKKEKANPGDICLEVKNLHVKNNRELTAIKNLSFNVRYGEILGVAGIEGNGQTELIEALSGLRKSESGDIKLENHSIVDNSIRERFNKGLAHIPEDRQKHGLVLDFTVAENVVLQNFFKKPFSKGMFINYEEINEYAKRLVETYDIRTPSVNALAKNLSGGNQQKVILAREFEREPKLILAAQPTRGLDIGAIEFIHRRLIEQRDAGNAVLLISLELNEILSLSDRIIIIYEGEIVGELTMEEATENKIGILMAGGELNEGTQNE
ncbi:MAG: ABC transporter ATP-binding protein [Clostridia bacterium]